MTLSQQEKTLLFKKLEYTKKKKYTESNSEIYQLLNSNEDSDISDDTFIKILNSLEYTFKNKLKTILSPLELSLYGNLQSKIPTEWSGPKQRKP